MKLRPILAVLAFLILPLTVWADTPSVPAPKSFEAIYKARYHGISVTATRSLQTLEDGTQKFIFHADSWLASLKETSLFRWGDNNHIKPIRYRYERSGLGRNREAVLDFDLTNLTVINNVERRPWQMDVPEGVLDKLNYQLQIRADLLSRKPLLQYDIADGGKLKQYSFEVLGEEVVKTEAGRFNAVKIRRVRDPDDDRHTTFWMAKDWDYMIVRLQQKDEDSTYEIDLHRATLDGRKVKGF